jgi:hypothetical protein
LSQPILMITAFEGCQQCATELSRQLGLVVETASSRKAALIALRHTEYCMVVVDDSLVEADPAGAELIWKLSGLAVPMQVNYAISGVSRLARDIRSALSRREQEKSLAMRAAASAIENELRSTVAGLLLHSQLALAEPAASPTLTRKLKIVVELAGNLKEQLTRPQL